MIQKDYNTRKVFNSCGELTELKLKHYESKVCGHKSQVELLGVFSPYAKIPVHVKESVRLSLDNGPKTVKQHSKDIKLYNNIPISHETARKSISLVTDSKIGYDTVMRNIGFIYHQHCVFHLLQRINDLINEQVNNFKKNTKQNLKQLI